jgi:integrase
MAKRGNLEGSIFKRPNGTWGAALQVDGRRKFVYAKTRREVQEKLQQLQKEAQAGQFKSSPTTTLRLHTVHEFLAHWLNSIVKPTVRPKTWDHYDLCVRRVLPCIGKVKLTALSANDIRAMEAYLQENKGLANRTVRHCHSVLHMALKQAVTLGLLERNPAKDLAAPRAVRREMRTLSRDEVRRLLASSAGSRWHALWAILVATGLRLGEATALRWSDLDLGKGTATIQRSVQRQKGVGMVFVEPKTQGSRRTVQLPPGAIAILKEHCPIVLQERLSAGALWNDLDLVFPSLIGGPIDPARVNESLHTALHKASLPRLRVHDLRHTAATLLLEEGAHPKVVQDLLGHSTIAMTLDLYSHVTPRLQQEAVSKMQGLVFDALPPVQSHRRGARR